MKKILVIALVMLTTVCVKAENPIKWGVTSGLNYTSISGYSNSEWKFGYKFGIISDIPLNNRFSFQPSLLFSSKGFKDNDWILTNEQGVLIEKGFTINANYIEIPLLFAWKMPVSTSTFSIFAGPYVAYGVAGKTSSNINTPGVTFSDNWNTFEGITELHILKMDRFDWGFTAGIAEEIGRFKISLSYDQGVKSVYSTGKRLFTDEDCYNYGLTLGLGVYF